MRARPFRFGMSIDHHGTQAELVETAKRLEDQGYHTLLVADHLDFISPMVTLGAVATVTDRIRLGTLTINNDFRHPALLAQDAAMVDIVSNGRFELGIGAGHAKDEYDSAGLPFDRGRVRVERLAESLEIMTGLFAGETVSFAGEHYQLEEHQLQPPSIQGADLPVLVGGGGPMLLGTAARHARIVQFTGFTRRWDGGESSFDVSAFSGPVLRERVALVREAAMDRDIELSALVQKVLVTDDRPAALEEQAAKGWEISTLDDTPFMLFGTVDQIVEQLHRHREEMGISYFTVFERVAEGFERVIERLAGT